MQSCLKTLGIGLLLILALVGGIAVVSVYQEATRPTFTYSTPSRVPAASSYGVRYKVMARCWNGRPCKAEWTDRINVHVWNETGGTDKFDDVYEPWQKNYRLRPGATAYVMGQIPYGSHVTEVTCEIWVTANARTVMVATETSRGKGAIASCMMRL